MDGARRGGGLSPPSTSVENYAKLITNLFYLFILVFILLLFLVTTMLNFLGRVIHHWKGVFKTFPTAYYKPSDSKKSTDKSKKKIAFV